MRKVRLITKAGADISNAIEIVQKEFGVVDYKFSYSETLDPIIQTNIAKEIVNETKEQVIVFADANDFPVILATVVREVAWERGYYCGSNHEQRQYLEKENIEVYVVANDSLLRLI